MAQWIDSLDSWCYNLSNNDSDYSVSGVSHTSDFIPRYYHNELVSAALNSSKIIFLPTEQDKVHVVFQLAKRTACDLRRRKKRIVYVTDSVERGRRITTFLRKHVDVDVTVVAHPQNGDISAAHFIVYCTNSTDARNTIQDVVPSVAFLILDDCVRCMTEHPLKEIAHIFLSASEDTDLRIIGLTSTLIHRDVQLDDSIYEYFIHMEKILKSTILTSHYCNAVNKYLTPTKFKRVTYTCPEKWMLRSDAEKINRLVEYLYTLINRFECADNERMHIISRLKVILDNFVTIANSHGLFPSLIAAGLSRIALEKLTLMCSDDTLFIVVRAIVSDFSVISAWLETAIRVSGSPKDVCVVEKSCDFKITKTYKLLREMDVKKNCLIFVRDTITAQMLTDVLRELASLGQQTFLQIECVTIDGSNREFETDREELYHKKNARKVLKRFLQRSVNVLILPWKTSHVIAELTADRIFYFDLPPDCVSYVISQKYGNCIENEQYFFVEKCNVDMQREIEQFAHLSVVMREVLQKKNVLNENEMRKSFRTTQMTDEKLKETYSTLITKDEDLYSGIGFVNRYCESLPTDAFTRVAPRWTMEKTNDRVMCKLELPLEPSIRFVAETEPVKNTLVTKQIAALKAIQNLRALHHLDDEMLPQLHQTDADVSHDKSLFPLWRDERDDFEAGTSNCCRVVPIAFPEWLYDCAPEPGVDCYVHVIYLNPVNREPPIEKETKKSAKKMYFLELLKSREEFGIVTRKKLPDICQFPVYNELGPIHVSIKVNMLVMRFTQEEVDKLFAFHRFIFLDVLDVVKRFLVADRSRKENSFFVTPLRIDGDSEVQLAWDVIENAFMVDVKPLPDAERVHTHYKGTNYVGKIITPWYRVLPIKNYIVTKILNDITPMSPFPSNEHQTYISYFSDKYNINIQQPNQPLLDAGSVPTNYNCIRPRAKTPGSQRRLGEKETDFDETLIPELCVLQQLPAVYWYKSLTLLAIAYRLHYILLAEMIRQRVAAHDQNSSRLKSWPTDEIDVLEEDNDHCVREYEEPSKPVIPIAAILKDVKPAKRIRRYPWAHELLPVDVDRNTKTTCVLEVLLQHDFMRQPDPLFDSKPSIHYSTCEEILQPIEVYPRFLRLECELSPGPKQSDIYQALSSVKCGDVVNFRSFKIIGRSFLTFAASLLLYRLYPNLNVQQLRNLRAKLIGKRNLFYCGSKLELGSCLKLYDVNPMDPDWNIGGFSIPEHVLNAVNESDTPPDVIFQLDIPHSERISGIVSAETRNKIHEKILKHLSDFGRDFLDPETSSSQENDNHVLIRLRKQSVSDKTVVEALKALTGVYLVNCGVEAGLKFLQYMEVVRSDMPLKELFVANASESDPQDLYHRIFVARQFESEPLFVQAFTHHSCYPESSSECNQKLAFLGNALLDFLITAYVFERRAPDTMSNSELEDVRICLVNDVLFAVVLVRFGLHKHLQVQSPRLVEKIDKFVMQQQRVNHTVNHREYLFLVEETSPQIVDGVDVPKILSDTFKALMAAVFLQTADLKHVWRICYSLMRSDIDTFMRKVPKNNPVKLLGETDLVIEYEKPKSHGYDPTLRVVHMHVSIDNSKLHFTGVGENTQQAKLVAAKLALKNMSKHFTL